jgi:hypothetical protein
MKAKDSPHKCPQQGPDEYRQGPGEYHEDRALLDHVLIVSGEMRIVTHCLGRRRVPSMHLAPVYPESPVVFDDPKDWEER